MPTKMSKQSQMEETFARVAWPQYNQMNREAYLEIGEGFIIFITEP